MFDAKRKFTNIRLVEMKKKKKKLSSQVARMRSDNQGWRNFHKTQIGMRASLSPPIPPHPYLDYIYNVVLMETSI